MTFTEYVNVILFFVNFNNFMYVEHTKREYLV